MSPPKNRVCTNATIFFLGFLCIFNAKYANCDITLSGPTVNVASQTYTDNVVVDGATTVRIVSCNFQKTVTVRLSPLANGGWVTISIASSTFAGNVTVEGVSSAGATINLNASITASNFYNNNVTFRQVSMGSGSAISLDSLQAPTTSIRFADLTWTAASLVLTKLTMIGTLLFPRIVISNCTCDTVSSFRILEGTFRVPNPNQLPTILVVDSRFTEKSILQLSGLRILSEQSYNDGQGVVLSGSTVFRSGSTLHCESTTGLILRSVSATALQIHNTVTFDQSVLNVSLAASVGAVNISPIIDNTVSGSTTTMIVSLLSHNGASTSVAPVLWDETQSRLLNLQLNIAASAFGILTVSNMTLMAASVIGIVRGTTLDTFALSNIIGTGITVTVESVKMVSTSYSMHRLEMSNCLLSGSTLVIVNSVFRVPNRADLAVFFLQITTFTSETLLAFKGNTIVSEQSYNDGGGVWFGAGIAFYDSNFEISGGSLQLRSKTSWLILFSATDAPTWKGSNFTASLAGSVGSVAIAPNPGSEFRHFSLNLVNTTVLSTLSVTSVQVAAASTFQVYVAATSVNAIAFSKLRFQSSFQSILIGPATVFDTLLITQSSFAEGANISILSTSSVTTLFDVARVRFSQVNLTNCGCLIAAGTFRVPSVRDGATLLFENVTAVGANISILGVTLLSEQSYNDARGVVIHPSCRFFRSILNVSGGSLTLRSRDTNALQIQDVYMEDSIVVIDLVAPVGSVITSLPSSSTLRTFSCRLSRADASLVQIQVGSPSGNQTIVSVADSTVSIISIRGSTFASSSSYCLLNGTAFDSIAVQNCAYTSRSYFTLVRSQAYGAYSADSRIQFLQSSWTESSSLLISRCVIRVPNLSGGATISFLRVAVSGSSRTVLEENTILSDQSYNDAGWIRVDSATQFVDGGELVLNERVLGLRSRSSLILDLRGCRIDRSGRLNVSVRESSVGSFNLALSPVVGATLADRVDVVIYEGSGNTFTLQNVAATGIVNVKVSSSDFTAISIDHVTLSGSTDQLSFVKGTSFASFSLTASSVMNSAAIALEDCTCADNSVATRIAVSSNTFDGGSTMSLDQVVVRVPSVQAVFTITVFNTTFNAGSRLDFRNVRLLSDQSANNGQGILIGDGCAFQQASALTLDLTSLALRASSSMLVSVNAVSFGSASRLRVKISNAVGSINIAPELNSSAFFVAAHVETTKAGAFTYRGLNPQLATILINSSQISSISLQDSAFPQGSSILWTSLSLDTVLIQNIAMKRSSFQMVSSGMTSSVSTAARLQLTRLSAKDSLLLFSDNTIRVVNLASAVTILISQSSFTERTIFLFQRTEFVCDQSANVGDGFQLDDTTSFLGESFLVIVTRGSKLRSAGRPVLQVASMFESSYLNVSVQNAVGSIWITPKMVNSVTSEVVLSIQSCTGTSLWISNWASAVVTVTVGPGSSFSEIKVTDTTFSGPNSTLRVQGSSFDTLTLTRVIFDASQFLVSQSSSTSTVSADNRFLLVNTIFRNGSSCLLQDTTWRVSSLAPYSSNSAFTVAFKSSKFTDDSSLCFQRVRFISDYSADLGQGIWVASDSNITGSVVIFSTTLQLRIPSSSNALRWDSLMLLQALSIQSSNFGASVVLPAASGASTLANISFGATAAPTRFTIPQLTVGNSPNLKRYAFCNSGASAPTAAILGNLSYTSLPCVTPFPQDACLEGSCQDNVCKVFQTPNPYLTQITPVDLLRRWGRANNRWSATRTLPYKGKLGDASGSTSLTLTASNGKNLMMQASTTATAQFSSSPRAPPGSPSPAPRAPPSIEGTIQPTPFPMEHRSVTSSTTRSDKVEWSASSNWEPLPSVSRSIFSNAMEVPESRPLISPTESTTVTTSSTVTVMAAALTGGGGGAATDFQGLVVMSQLSCAPESIQGLAKAGNRAVVPLRIGTHAGALVGSLVLWLCLLCISGIVSFMYYRLFPKKCHQSLVLAFAQTRFPGMVLHASALLWQGVSFEGLQLLLLESGAREAADTAIAVILLIAWPMAPIFLLYCALVRGMKHQEATFVFFSDEILQHHVPLPCRWLAPRGVWIASSHLLRTCSQSYSAFIKCGYSVFMLIPWIRAFMISLLVLKGSTWFGCKTTGIILVLLYFLPLIPLLILRPNVTHSSLVVALLTAILTGVVVLFTVVLRDFSDVAGRMMLAVTISGVVGVVFQACSFLVRRRITKAEKKNKAAPSTATEGVADYSISVEMKSVGSFSGSPLPSPVAKPQLPVDHDSTTIATPLLLLRPSMEKDGGEDHYNPLLAGRRL